ncbi:polyamine ABC transporter substrate-binding protein [Cellulomonas soli]|uniref:ABC transporter substrate-binding protein n=1 Tax=Cellulomonas soli TaxID=931535 RepID=A0A512PBI5_9CELL|nr:spermidine/putrescine ABC transporter substrate-binding protein [Cellulomonas soli]NYI61057.1 spermidine/putrescine transport system substrate-binding protein [Cellulomonas soli]GEP68526.1 ABC transporter substrate-binding protein [Cellulomonas soli]
MTAHRRPPLTDPRVRALVAAAGGRSHTGPSRRTFLLGALGTAGAATLLAACGTGGTTGTGSAPSAGADLSETDKLVRWANWTLYLDQDDSGTRYPTLEAFTEKTGIEVEYSEDIDDNDSFYGKVSGQLANGQDIGYDIMTLTDWMAARMIRLGYTQELDRTRIPNAENILPNLADVDFDPGRAHSLTWQSGFGGLAWDKSKVPGGLHTVSDLWAPELAGRVEVLSEMRDTVGLIMFDQGVDPGGTWGDDEFAAALDVLKEKIDSGHIRQVRGNSYAQDLVSGDAVAVIGWSGDITALNYENDDRFEFAIPEAGGTLWSDNLMIPIGATHKANAETLFDYYYDPEVAAQVAAWVNYITPVQGAQAAMEAIDPELAANTLIFPDEATLAKVSTFRSLAPDEEERYNGDFLDVIGA